MDAVFTVLRKCWDFFSIQYPGSGLTFGSILIGAWIVVFSLGLLRPILGIGGSLANSALGRGRRSSEKRPKSRRQEQQNGDYEI